MCPILTCKRARSSPHVNSNGGLVKYSFTGRPSMIKRWIWSTSFQTANIPSRCAARSAVSSAILADSSRFTILAYSPGSIRDPDFIPSAKSSASHGSTMTSESALQNAAISGPT